MDKLTIARMVAAHPRMVKLTRERGSMYNRLRNDYGREFMGLEYAELPTDAEELLKLQAEEVERGQEGVNRWTRPERKAYMSLERRIMNLRNALTDAYGQTA